MKPSGSLFKATHPSNIYSVRSTLPGRRKFSGSDSNLPHVRNICWTSVTLSGIAKVSGKREMLVCRNMPPVVFNPSGSTKLSGIMLNAGHLWNKP